MEDLFDVPNPLASEPPVVPLGKRVFSAPEYHLKVASAVVLALGLPHQIRDHDRNTIAAHFNKRKPDASDVSLPADMPIDKYSAHINQSGDALLNTLIGDAQRWCQQRTYDGSKLSNEVLKSNLVLMLRKRLDSMFEGSDVFSSKQRQLVENVFGVQNSPSQSFSSKPRTYAPPSSTFSSKPSSDLNAFSSSPKTFSEPKSSSFASSFTAAPAPSTFNPSGSTYDCDSCEAGKKKKKKSKAHKKEKKPEMDWRRDVYTKPAQKTKALAQSFDALSIDVIDPSSGKLIAIPLTPIAAAQTSQAASIFDTNKSVDVSSKWRPEYFGRIKAQQQSLTEQFLAYGATQIKNSDVGVVFLPTEAKLVEVKATADKRNAPIPFDNLWARHAAVHVNTSGVTHQARSLADNIGSVYHDGKTLSVPKLGQHYVKIIESKQQQIGGKTVTVHIHEGLFIQQ